MSKRETFLAAACKDNVEEFLRFIELHKDKAEPFDVQEVVEEMPVGQRSTLWGKLGSLLQDVLQELPPERWVEDGEDGMEVESAADPTRVMAVVDGVTLVAYASIKVLQDGDTYGALLEIAHRLHTILVSLPFSEAPLQRHIHMLCEAWWKKGLKEKEQFGRTAFFISLQRSFTLKKLAVEIQRVWSLHDVLLSLDYTSEENKQITNLLLQCFHSPNYIRNDDGKRFLVFLFSWNVNFICVIHGTIKKQLPFYSKTMTTHIMEIYYRAWKKANGDFLEKIESSCIQDFMQNAIFLRRASPVHAKVRQIMSYFHSRQGCNKVDKMLCNLYKPILWKALSVPNFEVRANATLLFTEAFPVHDPEQNNQIIDETVQKQLDTAMGLLDDPHPTVRSNATLGVCKILAKCWELLPPTIITDFLKKLVTELAADKSSADVRCSVFKCLTIVLDNNLSHPLLEKLLPTLKYSLHDKSEKVRVAFLDMLIKIKAVRAAKFWDVCNMDHLLARLAIDSHPVSKRIVNLLFKSFFPVNDPEREWCCRCITLLQMNPMATRKFYQLAHKHTAPTNIIKLMLAIRRVVNSCIQSDCDQSDFIDSNKENSKAQPSLGNDTAVLSGLLEVVVILWRSVTKALKQNEEARKYTLAKFGSVMNKYFQTFEDERCTAPLIQLASFMPPAAAPTFSCGVLSRLRRMDSCAGPKQYSQLLDCMCSWGQAAHVLELVTDWLTEALPKQGDSGRRKVRIQETAEAKPDLALAYLEYLFIRPSLRDQVLALGPPPLKQLHEVLGNWRSVLYTHLSAAAEDAKYPSVETALKAFVHHGQLSAHLQHSSSEGREHLLSLEHVAAWVAERVLPFLAKRTTNDNDDDGAEKDSEKLQPLAARITESFLAVCRDVLLVGLADEAFTGQILHLCSLTLLSEAGYLCIPAVLQILKDVSDSHLPKHNKNDPSQEHVEDGTTVALGVVANIFQKIIELLARRLRKDPEEGKQLCHSAVPGLADFLKVAQTWDKAPLYGVFSTLFAVVVVEKRHLLQKMTRPEEVVTPESVEDLPPLSGLLLSVILKSSSLTRAFLTEVCSSFDSESISSLHELAAVLHVLAVIGRTGQSKASLRSAATSVQQQIHKHAVTSGDTRDVQRLIYESSVKTVNEILDL
uniref:Non-SMC condensin II complex, subunit G2 n=1 Tax=Gasterosteus aculeatus aculeatus TaxID=481459 RepID=G3NIN6_GASAC|nr:condensin-2 complex subunit G2 [Gasterosteus aculeatus aculeatus]XP_040023670.1 condensin-2 complex subunit G2 [Gasterosteus aculeatus aculeatus]